MLQYVRYVHVLGRPDFVATLWDGAARLWSSELIN